MSQNQYTNLSSTGLLDTNVAFPAAPVFLGLSAITPDGIDDLANGATTSFVNPVVVFKTVAGDTYSLYDNGVLVGTIVATRDMNGWPVPTTTDGLHVVTVTHTNAAGTSSPMTVTFTMAADLAAPSITNVVDAAGPMTGNVAVSGLATDTQPTIQGTGHAGDSINVFDKTTLLGTAVVGTDGTWKFQPTTPLSNGSHEFHATESDGIHLSAASNAYPVTVTQIMITGVSSNGVDVAYGGAAHGTLTVTGWLANPEDAQSVQLFVTGANQLRPTLLMSTVAIDGHTFTAQVSQDSTLNSLTPASIAAGTLHLDAQVYTAAGNFNTVSDARLGYTVTDDWLPPPPSITAVLDATGALPANVAPSGMTTDTQPTVQGTGLAGRTVNVFDQGLLLGSTLVKADGTWSLQPASALKGGAHAFSATESDSTGTSAASDAYPVTIPHVMIAGVTSNGTAIPDGGTAHGAITVTGWIADPADVNAIRLFVSGGNQGNGVLLNSVITVTGHTFTAEVAQDSSSNPQAMTAATYHFDAQVYTASGNFSTVSAHLGYTVTDDWASNITPAAPSITTVIDATGPLTGHVAASGIATDAQPVIQGTGHAGDTINVFDKAVLLGTAVVGTDGAWSFQPAAALSNGAHEFHATESNGQLTSAASNAYSVTVSTILITGVSNNGVAIPDGGTAHGTITVTGWLANPEDATSVRLFVTGANQGRPTLLMSNVTVDGHTFTAEVSQDSTLNAATPLSIAAGTFHLDAQVSTAAGNINTTADARLGYTITDDWTSAPVQMVSAIHADVSTVASDAAAAPVNQPAVSTTHTGTGADEVNTLHINGDHQVLDLAGLSSKTDAGKVSGAESIDLGGAHNALKLSLVDVLNLGQPDLFQKDGKQQMLVNGSNGDTVDLSNSHVAGVADGQWHQSGVSDVGGVTYNVYEHSGAHVELLVQQGVQTALHG